MKFSKLLWVLLFAFSVLTVTSSGCRDSEEDGSNGGTDGGVDGGVDGGIDGGIDGGTDGGTTTPLSALSACTGDGLRGFMGFLDTFEELLRHADDAPGYTTFPVPEMVTYHSGTHEFAWSIDVDGVGGTETIVSGQLVESTGANPADLSDGFQMSEVVLVPWEWTLDGDITGVGKFSVVGLDPDTVRQIIIEDTWYDDIISCHVEITSFGEHLDLADPASERFAFVLGFWVASEDYRLDNAFVTLGESTITVSGQYNNAPFTFDLDAETYLLVQ